jgi:PadR family transcriptional regulator
MGESMKLIKGTLEVMVLKSLSWGPLHGYAVSRWIEAATAGTFEVQEGALYPALRRMELRGWVRSEWAMTDTGREARVYRLTVEGRKRLRTETTAWDRYAAAMSRVLDAESAVVEEPS